MGRGVDQTAPTGCTRLQRLGLQSLWSRRLFYVLPEWVRDAPQRSKSVCETTKSASDRGSAAMLTGVWSRAEPPRAPLSKRSAEVAISPGAGRDAHDSAKGGGEMTMIGETACKRYIGKAGLADQKPLGSFDTLHDDILVRRQAR